MIKCKGEQENHGYVKLSETMWSFNQPAFDIITDKLANVFSFVQRVQETTNKKKQVFNIDMDKSRKNAIYYSNYDFPLCAVIDEV